ncbi:MAG: class I SAM-dependent methyltransferase [Sulfolobales archaeon]
MEKDQGNASSSYLALRDKVIEALSKIAREGMYEKASSRIVFGLDKIFRRILAENLVGRTMLDMGCGSGVMYKYCYGYLRLLDDKYRLNPLYILLDPLLDFIELTHRIYKGDPYTDIVQAYAEYLPFREKSIDTIISAFMLRDIIDLARTIVNMLYVAKKRIMILDFYKPPSKLVYLAELLYIYLIVPVIILLTYPRLIREYLYLAPTVITQNSIHEVADIFKRFSNGKTDLRCWFRCTIFLLKIQR